MSPVYGPDTDDLQAYSSGLTEKEVKNVAQKLRNISIAKILIYIFLILFTVIQIYPFIWLLLFSFKNNMEIFGSNVAGLPHKLLWSNYQDALTNGKVLVFLKNSAIVTIAVLIISTVVICMASYAIARMKWKLSKTAMVMFLLGIMIPINATLLPLMIVFRKIHIVDTYWSVILPYVGFSLPMGIYILTAFLKTIPREMEESSMLDGCSIYGTFFRIIVPIMRPAIATVTIFTFIFSWNELMFATTFINSSSMKTLTVGIMEMVGQYTTQWGPIGAGLVLATLPTIVIYAILSNQVQKSLILGAVKG